VKKPLPTAPHWAPPLWALLPVLVVLSGLSSQASAATPIFGTEDTVQFVADTKLTSVDDAHLFLGHLVTTHVFLLPYHVESKGLVFGISGDANRFIPLPESPQLAELKRDGYLPHELPEAELSLFDYLFGYSLEILLLALTCSVLARRVRAKQRSAAMAAAA
jgi:hypothetical protein